MADFLTQILQFLFGMPGTPARVPVRVTRARRPGQPRTGGRS
jgi:hypothetical protein